jgi:hypothetical protein
MFFVRQTWSKSAEINHEGHEGHKEFALAASFGRHLGSFVSPPKYAGLISLRLFTYIGLCLR